MAAKTQRRTKGAPSRSRRWLVLVCGLALAALAGWFLVGTADQAPLGDIDAASRAELERVLERAEREAGS